MKPSKTLRKKSARNSERPRKQWVKIGTVWTCADGTRVRICDMSDSHLLNTIKMLVRWYDRELTAACSFADFLTGEMAQDAMDVELNKMADGGPAGMYPILNLLCLEARFRGLEVEDGVDTQSGFELELSKGRW